MSEINGNKTELNTKLSLNYRFNNKEFKTNEILLQNNFQIVSQ